MKITKWLARKKLKSPLNMLNGDTLSVMSDDKTLLVTDIKSAMKVDEVGIFEGKVDGKDAVGGVFIGEKIKKHD